MTGFYTVKKIDNSRLRRFAAPNGMRGIVRLLTLGALIAAGTLVYAWQHFTCIQLNYDLESHKSELERTARVNQELKLEVAGLRSPSRVDGIARNQLGLTAPAAGQIAPFEIPSEPVFAELKGAMRAGVQ
jgi:cell division protein FtsL